MNTRAKLNEIANFICGMTTEEWVAHCNALTPEARQMLLGDSALVSCEDFPMNVDSEREGQYRG